MNEFFFSDMLDVVKCFSCHINIYGWRQIDDPISVHARLSPDCDHIQTIVDDNFIDGVS